jgi:hypothetical protein
MKRLLILLPIAALALAARAQAPADDDIAVSVEKRGGKIIVDVRMSVAAAASDAWNVLTDYDNMARFVSNLKSSAVLRRDGNRLEVEQIGEARRGPLRFTFETVRAVELVPQSEIRSTLIRGPFHSYNFVTRVAGDGSSAIVENRGEYEPTTWVPPVLGPAMIETETRSQYGELRREMLRRRQAAAASNP